ncbi:Ger(x)C family spore germination protein [Paenibacillus sp. LHD-117]|uniref:Ger(x)C family spore germination protein n=1 Tax=Paenibacillus sp. LHD-117 TaxID=3071412 RepID=UPI0027DF33D6|nr:Ger(x)C family spore germination protein [Paenibacillus sp. LHD-117]MDQ6420224.1 Ger(x)C family spore germination protein [Paenibacillus sp. LHD-117]
MSRKWLLPLLLVVMLALVTGCWNRRELNTLGIAVGVGIDKAGDQFEVSAQVVDPDEVASKQGGGGRSPVVLYDARGASIFEAMRKMTKQSPRKIYLSHVRILVIGESLAREGIADVLDFLSRDHELRTDFFIIVAKHTKAKNILNVMTPMEKIPAVSLFNSLESSEKAWAPTRNTNLNELMSDLTSEGKQAILTGIELKGDKEAAGNKKNVEEIDSSGRLQYTGLAAFKGDKLVGWLSELESKTYNYLTGHVKSTVGILKCPNGGSIALEVIRSKQTIKGKLENGKPSIDVKLRIEANVAEVACRIDLTKTPTIEEIEQLANQRLQSFIEASVKKIQKKYKADIFGFGQAIHRSEPKLWKQIGKEWDAYFAKLPVNVKVDVNIRRLGTVNNSFIQEMKE